MSYRSTRFNVSLMVGVLLLTATLTWAQSPYTKPDRSWINLSGTVTASTLDQFTLDYGTGLITVEMDDWDWYNEASLIRPGEQVTVYGRIDDGFYESRTIEASSVYVNDRNTFYYANAADEEGDYFTYFYTAPVKAFPEGSWVSVSGQVERVDGREFTLDTGASKIKVDTIAMTYNPLDDVGVQQIKKGDRVAVTGHIDDDLFEQREIHAQSIVSLSLDQKKQNKEKKQQSTN